MGIIIIIINPTIRTLKQSKPTHPQTNNITSANMVGKAPSEGQKVDFGQNAPSKVEGAGVVTEGSLAAESLQESGGFAANKGIHGENIPSNASTTNTLGAASNAMSRGEANDRTSGNSGSYAEGQKAKSNAGAAPTYVASQYAVDQSGPHGKNITEGFDDAGAQDGTQKAFNAAVGSKDDPSRAAELQFEQNNAARTRGAGPRDGEISNETKYDALNSSTSA